MATEKRLIDANRLKKVLDDSLEGTYTIEDSKTASIMAGTIIACGILVNEMPAVDAVEVVRCKDCRYRHTKAICQGRSPEWYCPNGERMSEKNAE